MRDFKIGDEVQAGTNAWPEELQGLKGRVVERHHRNKVRVFFPDMEAEEAGSVAPGYWPMMPRELIFLSPVEDAQGGKE